MLINRFAHLDVSFKIRAYQNIGAKWMSGISIFLPVFWKIFGQKSLIIKEASFNQLRSINMKLNYGTSETNGVMQEKAVLSIFGTKSFHRQSWKLLVCTLAEQQKWVSNVLTRITYNSNFGWTMGTKISSLIFPKILPKEVDYLKIYHKLLTCTFDFRYMNPVKFAAAKPFGNIDQRPRPCRGEIET